MGARAPRALGEACAPVARLHQELRHLGVVAQNLKIKVC